MTKTLFITGASSGIGAATAKAAAKAGWNVGLFARSKEKLNDLAAEIGDQALALPGDATSYDEQKAAIEKLADKFGQIDAVFANAGRGTDKAGTENGDPEEWKGDGRALHRACRNAPSAQNNRAICGDRISSGTSPYQRVDLQRDQVFHTRLCREPCRRNVGMGRALHGRVTRHGQHCIL